MLKINTVYSNVKGTINGPMVSRKEVRFLGLLICQFNFSF